MKSLTEVDALITQLKAGGVPLSDAVWETACACVGWPYVFGAEGRRTTKDGIEVRCFDCQGFTEWCLQQFGIDIKAAGCTSQWKKDSLWEVKGTIDTVPDDVLVCLFKQDEKNPAKMAHTGFGYHGQTCECSVGVQHFSKRKAKWTHWAMPKGISGDIPTPTPGSDKPTIRRGSTGVYVTLMQTELIQRGYDCGTSGADGIYGSKTEQAVRAFQKDHGLTADGICGPKTWVVLDSQPEIQLYTVHIPMLPLYKAEAFVTQYPGAWMTKEGGEG